MSGLRRLLALVLSVNSPGVGQLFNGDVAKGVVVVTSVFGLTALLFTGVTSKTFLGLVLTFAPLLILRIYAAIDAVWHGGTRERSGFLTKWYVALVLAVAIPFTSASVLPTIQRHGTFWVASGTMEPGLFTGDRVVVDLKYLESNRARRGDVVVFRSPESEEQSLVKRVIALGGEKFALVEDQVLIDDEPIADPWRQHIDRTGVVEPIRSLEPFVVPDGFIFVMGDNRDVSYDSRYFGLVSESQVTGVVRYIYWSSERRDRIGESLLVH